MDVFDLQAVIRLDTNDYTKRLKTAEKTSQNTANNIGNKIGGGLKKAAKVGVAALGGATAAAGIFAKSAIQDSISYESAFTGVMKTVDETATTSYDDISNAIKKMATETASSQEDIAGVAEVAGQLGVSADDIAGFTKTIVELGDTTNLSAEEAASALAKFTNITGDGQASVDRIGSAIVDLGNNFATTEADIVNMSSRLASAGTIAGLSSTDILGLSTAMSSVGINAEAGGTAMSQVLNKIGKAVDAGFNDKKLKLFAATSGMTAEQFSSAWKSSPVEALSSFIKGLDSAQKSGTSMNSILDQLGISGIRESNTVRSLALASDVMASAVDTANTAFEENTALTNEAEKRYGTTESKINQMNASIKNLKLALVDGLSPAFQTATTSGIDAITSLTSAFESGGMDGFMTKLGDVFADAVDGLVKKLPSAIDAGSKLLLSLIQGITNSIPQLATSAVEIVNGLVDALVTAAPSVLQGGMDLIVGLANGLSQALPTLVPKAVEIVTTLVQNLINNIPQLVQGALALIQGLAQGLLDAIPVLIEALPQIITSLVNGLLESIPQIIDTGVQLLTSLVDNLPTIIDQIVAVIPDIIDGIITAITDNLPQIIEAGIKLFIALVTNMPKIIFTIVSKIPSIITAIVKGIIKAIPKIAAAGLKLLGGLFKKIGSFIKDIPKNLKKIWDGIVRFFKEHDLIDIGVNLIKGLWNGISSMASWLWDKISGFFGGIWDGILGFFGINSPSRRMRDEVGVNLAKGLGVGFDMEYPKVKKDIEDQLDFKKFSGAIPVEATTSVSQGEQATDISRLISRMDSLENALVTAISGTSTSIVLDGREVGRTVRNYA